MDVKRRIGLVAGIVLFAVYFFCAARPIPLEMVLIPRWLTSIESGMPVIPGGSPDRVEETETENGMEPEFSPSIPFTMGDRFGYVSRDGRFSVNRVKKANISLSPERWAEYEAEPDRVTVHGRNGEALAVIEDPRGYPFFLDGRTFLIGSEQNAISEVGASGAVTWTYECASPLTCVDSAAGLVLAGSLDGVIELLDSGGRQIFSFEPGGSQYSVILGCAISRNGSRIAFISGVDDQRFLVLERFGNRAGDYKVVYHEFLGDGFRRPVYITFIEDDRWIVFECSGGLGFYEINARQVDRIALHGEISAFDYWGGQGMVFVVVSHSEDIQRLVGIRLPGKIIIESPFRSEDVFLGRIDSRLIVGGGQTLVSFDLEKR